MVQKLPESSLRLFEAALFICIFSVGKLMGVAVQSEHGLREADGDQQPRPASAPGAFTAFDLTVSSMV